jgi:hypothetical protein
MIFTRMGGFLAALSLVFGTLMIATGLLIGLEIAGPHEAALARYAPWARSSGALFDRGFYAMVLGIALGVLTEIRRALEPRPYVYERGRSEQDASY